MGGQRIKHRGNCSVDSLWGGGGGGGGGGFAGFPVSPPPASVPAPSPSDTAPTAPPLSGTAPVASNDSATGPSGGSVTVRVLDNDQDADGNIDRGSVRFLKPPANATLSSDSRSLQVPNEGKWQIKSDGEVTFVPAQNFAGNPTAVSYTVSDASGLTSLPATITITVTGGGNGVSLARWAPHSCGETSFREYMLFTQGPGDTLEETKNRFLYSAANCAGERSFSQPEGSLVATKRLTPDLVQMIGGYTVRRYMLSFLVNPANVQGYQVAHITTPNGDVCMRLGTDGVSAVEMVQSIQNDQSYPLYCGPWEKLS